MNPTLTASFSNRVARLQSLTRLVPAAVRTGGAGALALLTLAGCDSTSTPDLELSLTDGPQVVVGAMTTEHGTHHAGLAAASRRRRESRSTRCRGSRSQGRRARRGRPARSIRTGRRGSSQRKSVGKSDFQGGFAQVPGLSGKPKVEARCGGGGAASCPSSWCVCRSGWWSECGAGRK